MPQQLRYLQQRHPRLHQTRRKSVAESVGRYSVGLRVRVKPAFLDVVLDGVG